MRLLIIAMMFFITGCSIHENEQLVPEQLQGEWNWYRTAGGWGPYIDADTVEYSMTLKIYAQNEAEWYRNDTLLQKYVIVEGKDEWVKGDLVMFRQNENGDNVDCGLKIEHQPEMNELHLPTALCTDSPTYFFTGE